METIIIPILSARSSRLELGGARVYGFCDRLGEEQQTDHHRSSDTGDISGQRRRQGVADPADLHGPEIDRQDIEGGLG